MVHRRKWLNLCPVTPLRELGCYDEILVNVFAANPAITSCVLHAFLLNGYQVNVAAVELEDWLYSSRLFCADHLFAYGEILQGCYNVQSAMGLDFVCRLLGESGVECTNLAMHCWILLQSPLPDVKLTGYIVCYCGLGDR